MALFVTPIEESARLAANAPARRPAVGIFPAADFAAARQAMPELARHRYCDWLDAREGSQFGRALAGEDVALVRVAARSYLQWCALAGVGACEATLDEFAAIARAVRESGPPPVRLSIALPPSPIDWLGAVATSGATDSAGFLDWCACLNLLPSPAAAVRYAELLLEHLTEEPCEASLATADE